MDFFTHRMYMYVNTCRDACIYIVYFRLAIVPQGGNTGLVGE